MKKKSYLVCLFIVMFSFLMFGCEHKVDVENIYFNSPSVDGVVLVVGETYTPNVYFSPLYPTNSGYKIVSGDDKIVSSRNNTLTALTVGKTYIEVVSDENELIKDVMRVQVVANRTKLTTPTITYSPTKQAFVISATNQDGFVNGYSLDINGETINIGNVLEYSLADYNRHLQSSTASAGVFAYDRDLEVKVKATVSAYTSVFEDSNYSQTIKINQASQAKSISVVGNKLKIEKSKATSYEIYVDSILLDTTTKTSFDLSVIGAEYASRQFNIGVVAVGTAGEGYSKYNSEQTILAVQCIPNVEASSLDGVISWQSIEGVSRYLLYLDDQRTTFVETSLNYFDLKQAANFETNFAYGNEHTITIVPQLSETAQNLVASKNQKTVLNFNRLMTPQLECEKNLVKWQTVPFAERYHVVVTDSLGQSVLDVVTENEYVDFATDQFLSGEEYTVTVSAISVYKNGVNYLSSELGEIVVQKKGTVVPTIENYVLSFDTLIDNEYLVEIVFNNQIKFSQTYQMVTTRKQVELLSLGVDYQPGEYSVIVTHLGNDENSVDGDSVVCSLIRLEEIDSIELANSIISAEMGDLNTVNNANIKFDILAGETVVKTLDNGADLREANLPAGEYLVKLYVVGNGNSTMSVLTEDGELKSTATKQFKVLNAPTITPQSSQPKFDVNGVDGAINYILWIDEEEQSVQDLSVEFELPSGQTKIVKLQAIGNGVETIDSAISKEYKFMRINTPELVFDNTTNILSAEVRGLNYVLTHNGEDITTSFTLGTAFNNLVEGDNVFVLTLKASEDQQIFYIDSLPTELIINKQQNNSTIAVEGNKLVVTTNEEIEDYVLEVYFDFGEEKFSVNENNYSTINSKLDLTRTDSGYTINLLDDLCNPILTDKYNSFKVKIRYVANHQTESTDIIASTNYSAEQQIDYLDYTYFDMDNRQNQNIVISVLSGYNYNNYALVINNTYLLNFDETCSLDSENQKLMFDVDYIYSNVPEEYLHQINEIKGVLLNNKIDEGEFKLSRIGESILIGKVDNNTISLTSAKDNTNQNNSRKITVSVPESEFARQLIIKIYNEDPSNEEILTVDATPNTTDEIKYTFDLDNYGKTWSGTKKIVAFIKTFANTTGENDQLIYMFNSGLSNILEYEIVDNVEYSSDENKVYVTLPANVVGADIYKQTDSGLLKLNTNPIMECFDFGEYNGSLTIYIKAVASTQGNYTNSQLSDPISITKLGTPEVTFENGMIVISIDKITSDLFENTTYDEELGLESLDGVLVRFTRDDSQSKYISLTQKGVKLNGGKIIIEPSLVLKYGLTALTKETVSFDLVVKKSGDDLYLNSNANSKDMYGLFAPEQVKLPAYEISSGEEAQTLSWVDLGLNKFADGTDCLAGFVFKLVDENGIEYFSNENLVYSVYDAQTGTYKTEKYSSVISTTSISFPYGYYDEEGEVQMFASGLYQLAVKAVPKTGISSYNLCCSKYSEYIQINILPCPNMSTDQGELCWAKVDGATEYVLTIENLSTNDIQNKSLSVNKFGFDGFEAGGYKLTIKAISNKDNVVNSVASKEYIVYRLETYKDLTVDDGIITFTASKYFTQAQLIFTNTTTGISETLIFENLDYSTNIEKLKQSGTTVWTADNITTANDEQQYIVEIDESYLLNLTKGKYSLSIKLCGNSLDSLPIASSATQNENEINCFVKLAFDEESDSSNKTWIRVDERGVFTFACPDEYSQGGFNYQFGEQVSGENYSFYQKTMIYKLIVEINSIAHEMFTIDYNNYIANKSLLEGYYTEFEDNESLFAVVKYPYQGETEVEYLYFNVFKDNKINLNLDEFNYYRTQMSVVDNQIKLSSSLNTGNFEYFAPSLINGGVFVVKLHLLGSDLTEVQSDQDVLKYAYLSSNLYVSNSFVRYTENNLRSYLEYTYQPEEDTEQEISYTYAGDIIFQNKLKKDQNGNALDYPVYKLEVKPVVFYDGSSTENIIYAYYLYYGETTSREQAEQIAEMNKGTTSYSDIKYVPVEFLENNDEYLLFKFSEYFQPGNYEIKIRTLAGVGTESLDAKYLLNAKIPVNSSAFKRVANTDLQLSDGKMQFDLAYVLNDKVKNYITNYQVNIKFAEEEYTYQIDTSSQGVTIANNKLTYILPSVVDTTDKNGQPVELELTSGTRFEINFRAIIDGNNNYLNATFAKTSTVVEKSKGISTAKIEGGKILWMVEDETNYNGTTIRIELPDGRVVEINKGTDYKNKEGDFYYYEIGNTSYNCVGGGTCTITGEVAYTLKLLTKGGKQVDNAYLLNSDYSQGMEMNRLKQFTTEQVYAFDGVLTWADAQSEHVLNYVVKLEGTQTYTFTTESLYIDFTQQPDDNDNIVQAGNYSISIYAVGDDYITSMPSSAISGFVRLGTITGLDMSGRDISWKHINSADGYKVTFEWSNGGQSEQQVSATGVSVDGVISCTVPEELTGSYKITIQAIGVEKSKAFNGDVYEYNGSCESPNPVESIEFDQQKLALRIKVADDFKDSDSLRLVFDFDKYIHTSTGSVTEGNASTTIIVIDDTTYLNTKDNCYVYPLSEMGKYTDISVTVERNGGLSSTALVCEEIDLNYFAEGDGSESDPYKISTAEQLLNIKLKPTSCFKFVQDIDMSGLSVNAIKDRIKDNNGGIIAEEFTGVLNGEGFSLKGLSAICANETTKINQSYALFKDINNATIKNLNISESNENSTNLAIMFANSSSNVISLSTIAINATNAILENVIANNLVLSIQATSTIQTDGYFAGLVANATGSTFTNCSAKVEIRIDASFSKFNGDRYIGGMVAKAESSTFSTISTTEGITSQATLKIVNNKSDNVKIDYVGGVVGRLLNGEISNISTTINQDSAKLVLSNFGGIVGCADSSTIKQCTVEGTITQNANVATNTGAVVGTINSGSVEDCTIKTSYEISGSANNEFYIGYVAGFVSFDTNANDEELATIKNCNISNDFVNGVTTKSDDGTINVGIYGKSINDQTVTIVSCGKIN